MSDSLLAAKGIFNSLKYSLILWALIGVVIYYWW